MTLNFADVSVWYCCQAYTPAADAPRRQPPATTTPSAWAPVRGADLAPLGFVARASGDRRHRVVRSSYPASAFRRSSERACPPCCVDGFDVILCSRGAVAGAPRRWSRPGMTLVLMALGRHELWQQFPDHAATPVRPSTPATLQIITPAPNSRTGTDASGCRLRLDHAHLVPAHAGRRDPCGPTKATSTCRSTVSLSRCRQQLTDPLPLLRSREAHRRSRVRRVRSPAVRGSGSRSRDVHPPP